MNKPKLLREGILSIASDLREGSMTTEEAKKNLLILFGGQKNVDLHKCLNHEFLKCRCPHENNKCEYERA